jgi:hypothetical protein
MQSFADLHSINIVPSKKLHVLKNSYHCTSFQDINLSGTTVAPTS